MTGQDITEADAIELERVLIILERLGTAGADLAEVARKATSAILNVVDALSPAEVEVEWMDAEAA